MARAPNVQSLAFDFASEHDWWASKRLAANIRRSRVSGLNFGCHGFAIRSLGWLPVRDAAVGRASLAALSGLNRKAASRYRPKSAITDQYRQETSTVGTCGSALFKTLKKNAVTRSLRLSTPGTIFRCRQLHHQKHCSPNRPS